MYRQTDSQTDKTQAYSRSNLQMW